MVNHMLRQSQTGVPFARLPSATGHVPPFVTPGPLRANVDFFFENTVIRRLEIEANVKYRRTEGHSLMNDGRSRWFVWHGTGEERMVPGPGVGLKHSLHRSFRDARGFYLTFAALVVIAAAIVLIPGAPRCSC
jgi:hypothetical protein